ncbi:MAG: hypothetical protein BRD50_01175 [Bacteroidetes bacterium SW_11_45_7]|nr:MAG: hypothetical protein BRD50_01175 [Bacteroidetes bacterium SW_11_45_7]
MNLLPLFTIAFSLLALTGTTTLVKDSIDTMNRENKKKEDRVTISNDYEAERYSYDSLTIPAFFKQLTQNHLDDYMALDSSNYRQVCREYNLKAGDKRNRKRFFTISILHDLFTANQAINCSKGPVLNIPYMWHWQTPNKRKDITHLAHDQALKDIEAPPGLSRYASYAKVDRTPFLFLSDLFAKTPNYYFPECDTFSTFGWCSEREMAFTSLSEILNGKCNGKVAVGANHSWTELIVPMRSQKGKDVKLKVRVDNTYNTIDWKKADNWSKERWQDAHNETRLERWYNKKAHSEKERARIRDHIASNQAMQRIERKLVTYLNEQFKDKR